MRAVKLCALLALAFSLLVLPGCWGSKETDEVAYVLVAGFDKGEKDDIVVTANIANPREIAGVSGGGEGGGGGGSSAGTVTLSVESYAPIAALNLLSTVVDRQISLSHTRAYVFSEELAREGTGRWLIALSRYREVRGTAQIFVCRGKASDYINTNKPALETSPAKQFELIANLSGNHGLYPSVQFVEFYSHIKSFSAQALAPLVAIHEGGLESADSEMNKVGDSELGKYTAGEIPVAGESKSQVMGTAAFRGDKMVGTLNGQETRYYLLLKGDFVHGLTSIPDPFSEGQAEKVALIGFQLHQGSKPQYRTYIDENGNVFIDVEIFLEPEIVASTSFVSFERPDLKPVLEEAISKYIEQGCNTLVKRAQEEFRSDIFGFGYYVKRNFWTIKPWEEFNWLGRFPDAQVNITVHSNIRRTGLMLKTTPLVNGDEGS